MKRLQIVLAAATLLVFAAGSAMAASGSKTVDLKTTLTNVASLSIGATSLAFANGFNALPGAVSTTYTAKLRQASTGGATLTITGADLAGTSPNTATIPANTITLTPTVSGAGTANKVDGLSTDSAGTTAVTFNNSGAYTGDLSFDLSKLALADYQALPSDTYTGTQTLTLSAP